MLIRVPHVVGGQALTRVRELLAAADFADGRLSAGASAGRVKENEEVTSEGAQVSELNHLVMGNLVRHPVYKNAALPYRLATPYYVRYRQGMRYGNHIDDPVMGAEALYRSDIAITVFLNDPHAYEGGELVILTSFGEQRIKYAAGDAVLYPASSRHHVSEVMSGERLVAVTWAQSLIREPDKRALLYELNQAREKLLKSAPESEETQQVDNSYINLVRMWAEV